MKCLPTTKLPQASGNVLHDWHAEVLAIRTLNSFLLNECKEMLSGGVSRFLRRRKPEEIATTADSTTDPQEEEGIGEEGEPWHGQPFTWREDVKLHMYCTEAPCGDASMELIMAAQEDATPWDVPEPPPTVHTHIPVPTSTPTSPPIQTQTQTQTPTSTPPPTLPGRAYFSHLGIVRRKPARPDAPPTLSKSCSDKLAQHQATSLLLSPTSILIHPRNAYLQTLILPEPRHSEPACRRAFSARPPDGRMRGFATTAAAAAAEGGGRGGYAYRPFAVQTTAVEFAFSQRSLTQSTATGKVAPTPTSLLWTPTGVEENTIGGTLQGRKQCDPRGACSASRRKLWGLAVEVAAGLPLLDEVSVAGVGGAGAGAGAGGWGAIQKELKSDTYGEMKESVLLEARRRVKEEVRAVALQGWVRNLGDENFGL